MPVSQAREKWGYMSPLQEVWKMQSKMLLHSVLSRHPHSANSFALFLKSQRKWSSPPLEKESISAFKSRMNAFGYSPSEVLPHGSYLINLGNPDQLVYSSSWATDRLSQLCTSKSDANRMTAF